MKKVDLVKAMDAAIRAAVAVGIMILVARILDPSFPQSTLTTYAVVSLLGLLARIVIELFSRTRQNS